MMFCSMWILYLAFARLAHDRIARIAVIPLMGILATIHTWDLQHYASEVPTLILVSGAVYCTVRIYEAIESSSKWFACLGLLVGLSFFAKMQSVPLLLSVVAVTLCFLLMKSGLWWPALCWLCIGGAVPFALNAIVSGAPEFGPTSGTPTSWPTWLMLVRLLKIP
jgi:hypothetical protein